MKLKTVVALACLLCPLTTTAFVGGPRTATNFVTTCTGCGNERSESSTPTSIHRHRHAAVPDETLPYEEHQFSSSPSVTSTAKPSKMNLTRWAASAGMGLALLFWSGPVQPGSSNNHFVAMAYDPSDYASETVQSTIKALKDAAGNAEETYKVYEEMNSIITEGKGIGGAINYKGIQLERGYVADEDTSIYNPGLTLLTESEKERLVEAVIVNRKVALQNGNDEAVWPKSNQLAFEFLRQKLDPFHVVELRGYLKVLPFYAAAVYLAVLAIQQFLRELFPAAYIVGVVAIFAPALFLLAFGGA